MTYANEWKLEVSLNQNVDWKSTNPTLEKALKAIREKFKGHDTILSTSFVFKFDCLKPDCQMEYAEVEIPQPDWSIVDLWVARHLLSLGKPAVQIQAVLRLASPHFPRRHGDPDDYLRRTIARAAFPSPGGAVWPHHDPASAARLSSACSNSTGGR